jgi:hypothetical protein
MGGMLVCVLGGGSRGRGGMSRVYTGWGSEQGEQGVCRVFWSCNPVAVYVIEHAQVV